MRVVCPLRGLDRYLATEQDMLPTLTGIMVAELDPYSSPPEEIKEKRLFEIRQ